MQEGVKPMAMEKTQVYQCGLCGNIVEMIHTGGGTLVCCQEPMRLLVENTTDAAREKHVPVVEKVDGRIKVKVGSVAHPMEEKHHIEWIEAIAGGKCHRQFLSPGDPPEAELAVEGQGLSVRAFCNLHGLWKAG